MLHKSIFALTLVNMKWTDIFFYNYKLCHYWIDPISSLKFYKENKDTFLHVCSNTWATYFNIKLNLKNTIFYLKFYTSSDQTSFESKCMVIIIQMQNLVHMNTKPMAINLLIKWHERQHLSTLNLMFFRLFFNILFVSVASYPVYTIDLLVHN